MRRPSLPVALTASLLLAGCIANPTPHPSVIDQGGGFQATDTGGGGGGGGGSDTAVGVRDAGPEPDILVGPAMDAGAPEPDVDLGWENGAPCVGGTPVGAFEVGHWGFYAAITGEVSDGVVPLAVLQPVETIGACTLMQKQNPLCDPACSGGDLCDHDGTCVPYPAILDAGAVTVDGLLVEAALEPNVTGAYAKTDVPFPLFEAGAAVTVSAAGGDVEGFTLSAWGVDDLEVPTEPPLTLARDADLAVTWTASDGPGLIHLRLNVDQHGNSPVTLVCDVEDTGSHTIPAALVNALLDFGVSGFATFDLYRRTLDTVELSVGCVELRVFAYAQGKLVVEGHTACTKDADCPAGQTCNLTINTCIGGRR